MQLLAENLSVDRGTRTILKNLSFTVASGECLAVTGINGSGKTTLLRTLAGFIRHAKGRIEVIGAEGDLERGERCHYVGHLNGIKTSQSVRENLQFYADYLTPDVPAGTKEKRITMAMNRLALGSLAAMPAGYLSAGQKRRLALARILCVPRPIWLLDEPSVSLDAGGVAALADIIDEHTQAGSIVVAATHRDLGLLRTSELGLSIAAAAA